MLRHFGKEEYMGNKKNQNADPKENCEHVHEFYYIQIKNDTNIIFHPNIILMFQFYNQHRVKVLEEIPSNTHTIRIHCCRHLEIIKNIPPSVQEIYISYAPNLRTIQSLPEQLKLLHISFAPYLRINSLPSSLEYLHWYDINPSDFPEIPQTVIDVSIMFDRMPDASLFTFNSFYYSNEQIQECIQNLNKYFVKEKVNKMMTIIGHELRLKAISPERVAKWLGSEENPQWELLDSILGID